MPVYFIRSDQIDRERLRVGEKLEHHLRNVLRLKVGESIILVDETPIRYYAKIVSSHPGPLVLRIEKEERALIKLPHIRLGVGILKRRRMDWLIQKASELGVSRISPLMTERTVVRIPPERHPRQKIRWQKIATEAAQQSCQWRIPEVEAPSSLRHFMSNEARKGFKFLFLERFSPAGSNQKILQAETSASPHDGSLLIGPEGGWSVSEIREAEAAGFIPLSLGAQILRVETAALAALAVIQYEIANGNYRAASV